MRSFDEAKLYAESSLICANSGDVNLKSGDTVDSVDELASRMLLFGVFLQRDDALGAMEQLQAMARHHNSCTDYLESCAQIAFEVET